jgi:flagellar motility protein MotE (MotC chaperone)
MARKIRAGRGSILLIVVLLLGSAGLRIWVGAGQAWAKESGLLTRAAPEQDVTPPGPDLAHLEPMLRAFQEREARIAAREREIELRLKGLAIADEQIEKRLLHLQETEAALRATLELADGAAEEDLSRLTAVYENMKPKTAAALFEQMEPAFAAGFLGRMRPDSAAGIMAGLSPQIAYTISVILAGRNAKVPKG